MFREIKNPTVINSGVFRWVIFRFSSFYAEGERVGQIIGDSTGANQV